LAKEISDKFCYGEQRLQKLSYSSQNKNQSDIFLFDIDMLMDDLLIFLCWVSRPVFLHA